MKHCIIDAPVIKNKKFTHYNQKPGGDVQFFCYISYTWPTASVKWYKDGKQLLSGVRLDITYDYSGTGSKLTIRRLQGYDEGGYQCVVENSIGSDAKYFFLTIENSGIFGLFFFNCPFFFIDCDIYVAKKA